MRTLTLAAGAALIVAIAVPGVTLMSASTAAPAASIPVLEYHGISAGPVGASAAPYNVSIPAFTAQMAWLHDHGYRSITPGLYVAWLNRRPVTLPRKPILITFDDGRKDSQLALPVLRRFGFRATMFAVTAYADQGTSGASAWLPWSGLSGWDIQFHAGAEGHLTWQHPYYKYASLDSSKTDIVNGLAELRAKTGISSQTWAVPNGAWTAPLLSWAATQFKVIWLEGSMPAEPVSRRDHIRYRAEIDNGTSVGQMVKDLNDPKFGREY